jgi:hypothetical protein
VTGSIASHRKKLNHDQKNGASLGMLLECPLSEQIMGRKSPTFDNPGEARNKLVRPTEPDDAGEKETDAVRQPSREGMSK